MKRICLCVSILIFSLQLSAQDSLQRLHNKMDSLAGSIDTVKKQVTRIDTSIQPLRDTIRKIVNDQLIVGASVLDSARKFPDSVLYKTYLFDKKHRDESKKNKDEIKGFFATLAFIILALMWIGCFYYSKNDSLCKDVAFERTGNRIKPKDSPYSYARTQLLWWTMIILSCYIFFFGVTGVLLPLNVTSVLLLGFGALVYGAGKIIDNRQIAMAKGTRNQDLGGQNPESPDFIKDILSDDNGISIHRFQAVVFNVVFGIGFIGFFIKSLIQHKYPLPDFTEWQFALIGISSATYLGLKAAENNDPEKKKSPGTRNLNNESFPTNTNVSASIEYHDESVISSKPPTAPPPNIK
jgi:hypothetical protein